MAFQLDAFQTAALVRAFQATVPAPVVGDGDAGGGWYEPRPQRPKKKKRPQHILLGFIGAAATVPESRQRFQRNVRFTGRLDARAPAPESRCTFVESRHELDLFLAIAQVCEGTEVQQMGKELDLLLAARAARGEP